MIIQSSNERSAKAFVSVSGGFLIIYELTCPAAGMNVIQTEVARTIDFGEGLGAILDSRRNQILRDKEGCVLVFQSNNFDGSDELRRYFLGGSSRHSFFEESELRGLEIWMRNSAEFLRWSKCSPNDTVEGPDEVGMNFTLSLYKMALEEKKKS